MKIIYIAPAIVPSQTANSIHVMKMCQALAFNGHEVTLLIPDIFDKNIKTDDVFDFYGVKKCFKIIRRPAPGRKIGFFIFAFLASLSAKREKSDLVYTRFLYSAYICLLFGLPTIYEIHAPFEKNLEKFIFSLMNKNKLEKIVVISNFLRDYFIGKYKIDKNKIIVAPDGADSIGSELSSREIAMDKSKITIGYIGNLYAGRGMDVIAKIAERCFWVEFHIIGGYPDDLNYWRKELLNLKNIKFYGFVPHKEVYEFMVSFDALIAPYQKEVTIQGKGNTSQWMSPLKIFEYMAAGRVVLSSDLPVLREVLEHGKNSLLAPPEDIDKWISNLELIRDNVSLRNILGETAKKDFENNYTWKSRAGGILKSIHLKIL